MTRDEATAEIRSIGRTCRGPQVLGTSGYLQRRLVEFWNEIQNQADWYGAMKLIALLEDSTQPHAAIETWQAAYQRFRNLVYQHAGCGYDFNEIVIANPWDGQERTVQCPQCNVDILYTAPLYEITE